MTNQAAAARRDGLGSGLRLAFLFFVLLFQPPSRLRADYGHSRIPDLPRPENYQPAACTSVRDDRNYKPVSQVRSWPGSDANPAFHIDSIKSLPARIDAPHWASLTLTSGEPGGCEAFLARLNAPKLAGLYLVAVGEDLKNINKACLQLKRFPNLLELDLSENHLYQIPAPVFDLSQLQCLFVNDNRIQFCPAALSRLSNLASLNLAHNRLDRLTGRPWVKEPLTAKEKADDEFWNKGSVASLKKLRRLDVSGNRLSGLPFQLGELPLEFLDLSNNSFRAIEAEIFNAPLRSLYISFQDLELLPASINENPDLNVQIQSGLARQIEVLRMGELKPLPQPFGTQLLLTIAGSWSRNQGTVYGFERPDQESPWQLKFSWPVSLGWRGLGWGFGEHGWIPAVGPVKQEGDGRSPAGVFRLPLVFGYAGKKDSGIDHYPYLPLDENIQAIEDTQSPYYNRFVDRSRDNPEDWRGEERMKRPGGLYEWGVFVGHNDPDQKMVTGDNHVGPFHQDAKPLELGSCIFFHAWYKEGGSTAGCTASTSENIRFLAHWLKEDARPLLVQLPLSEYLRFRKVWNLPDLPSSETTDESDPSSLPHSRPPWLSIPIFPLLLTGLFLVVIGLLLQRRKRRRFRRYR